MKQPAISVSHFGICVTDLERATRFYTRVLGFEVSHGVKAGPPFDVLSELPDMDLAATFLVRDGVMIELLCYESPTAVGSPERRPMNQIGLTHMAISVDDIDAVADRIAEQGGQVLSSTRVDLPDKGSLMFCTDPDGVRLELWQKPV